MWFNKEAEPEKHYSDLITLFFSWKNEETDSLGMCSSHQEQYMLLSNLINDQMKQYDVCSKVFNETSLHHLIQKGLSDKTRLEVIRT